MTCVEHGCRYGYKRCCPVTPCIGVAPHTPNFASEEIGRYGIPAVAANRTPPQQFTRGVLLRAYLCLCKRKPFARFYPRYEKVFILCQGLIDTLIERRTGRPVGIGRCPYSLGRYGNILFVLRCSLRECQHGRNCQCC